MKATAWSASVAKVWLGLPLHLYRPALDVVVLREMEVEMGTKRSYPEDISMADAA